MEIKYYTNAMALLKGSNSTVLFDPWITFDRFAYNNQYNFPESKFTKDQIKSINPDFIYISHTHADHFDANTLELFSKNTPIICSYYKNNFTERNLKSLGFKNVIVCEQDKFVKLNGTDKCYIYNAEIYSEVDSLGLFQIDGFNILNANDVIYSENQMTKIGNQFNIDLAMVPYGYQGPYPAFYENLSENEKKIKSEEKKINNYIILKKYIQSLKPKYVFAFAAGVVYGGKKALDYNYYGVGNAKESLEYCKSAGLNFNEVLINGGESFNLKTKKSSKKFVPVTYDDQIDYLTHISKQKNIFEDGFIGDTLEKYLPHTEQVQDVFLVGKTYQKNLKRLLKKARQNQYQWQKKMNYVSKKSIFIDVGHEHLYRMNLNTEEVDEVKETEILDKDYEIFRCSYSLLIGMLTGHFNYSNVKSPLMTFYRKPDVFDPKVHILMSYLQL